MAKNLIEEFVADPKNMRLFQQERAIYEVTELLEEVMKNTGVNRTELAKRLGRTKGWVTQLLDGEANKTIRTIADAFAVLGREYHSAERPIEIGRRPGRRSSRELSGAGDTERLTILRFPATAPPQPSPRIIASNSEEMLIEQQG